MDDTDLGIAFENQPSEVFDSIQRLRAQARNVGDLRTTPEQVIIVENSISQIVPAKFANHLCTRSEPEIVYVRPPPAPGRINVHFNQGRPIGPWLNHDVDWRDREVVWKSDHARPQNWWYEAPSRHPRVGNNNVAVNNQTTINNNQTTINNNQTTINNNQTTINNNYTVWRPHGREAGSNNNSRATREPDNRPNQNQNPPVAAQPSPRPGSRNTRVTPLPGPEPVNTQNTVVSQPLPVNPPPTQALTNRVRPEPPRNIPATNTPPIVAHTDRDPVVRPGTLRPAPAAPAHTNRPVGRNLLKIQTPINKKQPLAKKRSLILTRTPNQQVL